MSKTKKIYIVMRLERAMEFAGRRIKLPEGEAIVPAFDTFEKAREYSQDGKFDILECGIEVKE